MTGPDADDTLSSGRRGADTGSDTRTLSIIRLPAAGGSGEAEKERNMGQIRIIKCPKCGAEIRREEMGRALFRYGSPFRKCLKCGTEYYDDSFHEMALEQDPPSFANESKKDKKWYRILHHAEIRDAEEYRRSRDRLRNRDYLNRLCGKLSDNDARRMGERIDRLIKSNLSEYFDLLAEKIGPPAAEFRLKFLDELFSQLSYEAKKPAAVEYVVRRILSHYGVKGNITVQTEYQQRNLKNEKGTLGSFGSIWAAGHTFSGDATPTAPSGSDICTGWNANGSAGRQA